MKSGYHVVKMQYTLMSDWKFATVMQICKTFIQESIALFSKFIAIHDTYLTSWAECVASRWFIQDKNMK